MSDTTTATLAAVLWDFDGTLADTEPLWIAAEYELIDRLGGTWSDEHADQLVGNSLLDSGSYILNAIGRVDLSPVWVVEQLLATVVDHVRRHPIVWRPGAIELLRSFAEAGVPCGGQLPGLRGRG
jgi:beta-phosphoglucomutase-like phosphatase (HAD superfamily)